MKNINTLILILLESGLNAQQIENEPNIGLAISTTGASICILGATMGPLVTRQYNPGYGYNYINITSESRKQTQITALLFGSVFTISGLIIQNLRKHKKSKQAIKI